MTYKEVLSHIEHSGMSFFCSGREEDFRVMDTLRNGKYCSQETPFVYATSKWKT